MRETEDRRAALVAERARLRDTIDQAYWAFTRQARGIPPSLAVPEAFAQLRTVNAALAEMDATCRRTEEDAWNPQRPA